MEEAGIQAVIKGLAEFKAGSKEMDQAIAGIGQTADKTKAPVSRLQASFADLEAKAAKAIIPLAAVSAVLVATVGKMTMTAARTEELGVVVENMGRVAGYSEEQLAKVENEIKDLGITTQSARTIITRFIGAELDLADASKIARAAQDLAVIGMEDSSTAAANLTYAIASMQPRILRQYGLFVNLNTVYEESATALGKTVEELTETEKRQGFLNAVLAQAANYAGTYEAAMGTAGKQIRSFSRYTEEISNELGQHFLPYLAEGVGLATKFAKAILGLSDESKAGVAKVLMYATAISVMATGMATAILMAGKLKAALLFMINPYVLVAAAIGFLIVRSIEWRMELKKQEDELLETTKTAKEYIRKMGEVRESTDKAAGRFGFAAEELKKLRLETAAESDALRWLINYYEESGWAAAEMGEKASRALGVTGEYIAKADAAAEAAAETIRTMGQAFYGNILAIQDNMAAYDALQKKIISVSANTADTTYAYQKATQRAEEDAALRREELLEKHAEKIAWVETGAHARSKKEHEEALGYWMAINAEELREFDAGIVLKQERRTEDYNHAVATAQRAAAERARIEEEQRQAELQAMREAQEERLALLAIEMIAAHETLTVMSPWGELEVSAQEYYEAVKSGLVPVSDAMRTNLGTAIQFIDDQMATANKNIGEGYDALSAIIEGVVPEIMELGTTTEEESTAMTAAMEARLRPSVQKLDEDVKGLASQFNLWADEGSEATAEVGTAWEGLHQPMEEVQTKVGETEQFYDERMVAMQTKTEEAFDAIDTAVDDTMAAVHETFVTTMQSILNRLVDFEEDFHRMGRKMIQGLIEGVESKREAAEQAMRRLVKAMIKAAQEAAGVESPSRIFRGMGRDVMAGFIQGIESMQPALDAQMHVALSPAIQVAAPQAAASPVLMQGGHTYQFNLSAHYAQVQSPASIMDDLQAMEMLAGARG